MMFSGGIIPSYLLISKLGLIDSLWSLILPGMMTAYNVILMKTFFQSLPISLTESATLDGATEVQVFFRIILPLSKAILATIVLFYAVMFWNDFFNGIMYINDRTKKPLQVVLREILLLATADSGSSNVDSSLDLGMNVQMAVAIVSMIPIICVYPFLQKYFTKGVLIGAVKG
jgi:putative aldouronate transport system permease protein